MTYGLVVWGNRSSKLFKLQKRAIRLIVNAKYNSHTDKIFKELKLLKISDLYALQELKFVYKLEKRLLPMYFLNKLYMRHSDRHRYDTRYAQNYDPLLSRHNFTKNSICYRVPEIMNNSPECILSKISTHSISGYVYYIKMWYLDRYSTECLINNCYVCNMNS